jgi:mycothiol synthase
MRPVRTYQQLEYHPAPSYLRGDFRPLPDGYSTRTLDGVGEAAILRELQNICFLGLWGYAPNNDEDIAASLSLPGQGPENVLLLGEEGRPPEAYVWMQLVPSAGMAVGVIGMLGVHPDARGKGFGAVIGTAGIRNLRGRGAGVVKLEVDKANTPAKRIYRDLGFQERTESVWYELQIGPDNSSDPGGMAEG